MNALPHSRKAVKRIEVVLLVAVAGLTAYLGVSYFGQNRVAARRQACLANLGRIGEALGAYLKDHDDHWPFAEKLASVKLHDPPWPTLPVILSPYLGGDLTVFHCPADRRILPDDSPLLAKHSRSTTWFETEGTSYEHWLSDAYAGKKVGEEAMSKAGGYGLGRADQPLLTDFQPFHKGDGGGVFNTLNADLKPRTTRAKEE